MYCKYYQAKVTRNKAWFFAGGLRSFDHLVFDRTIDKENSIFEFFVPADLEQYFLEIMHYFENEKIITEFKELPNRMKESSVQ